MDWLCLPDFSSPSVFARLLAPRRGGSFSIRPTQGFKSKRRYLADSAVLETTFTTETGACRVLDLLPVVDGMRTMQPLREVLRVLEGCSGEVEVAIELDPQPDYARRSPELECRGKLGWAYTWRDEIILVQSDVPLQQAKSSLRGRVKLRAGQRLYVSLAYGKADTAIYPTLGGDADSRLQQTLSWWKHWASRCTYEGPYREQVLRSAITLKLLTYALSGAIVAAPTTSLPEAIGGDRNWDYRYCWLRDAGLTNHAFVGTGYLDEARAFLAWLLHATRLTWPELQIVYDVFGGTELIESELAHLSGYQDSRPVRIGNGAFTQRQLDVYGEVVLAAEAVVRAGGRLDATEARMLRGCGEVVCRQWQEPDSSIWEIRGPPRQYTFSKVMCWLTLDRLLKLDEQRAISLGRLTQRFAEVRHAIADLIEQRGFNQRINSYTSEIDGSRVDASLLLMACLGYRDANHPRMISTYDLIMRRLGSEGLLARYEPGYDGVKSGEGAFGICSFWAVDNLAKRGCIAEAEQAFQHLLSFANDVGLYGEEIDRRSGEPLGNFPQAFTHVGLINAALAIESARAGGV